MAASKQRPLWSGLPASVRADIETLVGGRVARADNCAGGFSAGFASRLALFDGRRVFVKAMHAAAWPFEAKLYRAEAAVATALPATVPAPRLLGTCDDGQWVMLAFEDVEGDQPRQPWDRETLDRVAAAIVQFARAVTPSPVPVADDHPRLGGWDAIAGDPTLLDRLSTHSAWAATHLPTLIALESEGLVAARGESLVHFDLYPHNILLTPERVMFIDWPHARLGAPVIDLVMLLSSVAADGVNPEPLLDAAAGERTADTTAITAILAANAGLLIAGGVAPMPPGLEAIATAKLRLGLGAVNWLQQRSTAMGGWPPPRGLW